MRNVRRGSAKCTISWREMKTYLIGKLLYSLLKKVHLSSLSFTSIPRVYAVPFATEGKPCTIVKANGHHEFNAHAQTYHLCNLSSSFRRGLFKSELSSSSSE
jgi:hypothetical protein